MFLRRQPAWDESAAMHLLRRACFGGSVEEAAALAQLPREQAVRSLLEAKSTTTSTPNTDPTAREYAREIRSLATDDPQTARQMRNKLRSSERRDLAGLRTWWLERMHSNPGSAVEKLTLFWHSHFATSATKVRWTHFMAVQNETLRRLSMGPFPALVEAMACDPAMLLWLDGARSHGTRPNENFSREALELFCLGEGNYSEEDVREAARAFTGWTIPPTGDTAKFVARRHDNGSKTLLGITGHLDTAGAVEAICRQSSCAAFLTRKLWEFYVYPNPDPAVIAPLAENYRRQGLPTGRLLEAIFLHPEFWSDRARASQIKSPAQWLVQASKELHRLLLPSQVALPLLADLGQNLFAPPSVKGWDGGRAWINSGTLIRRSNTAQLFAVAAPPEPAETPGSLDRRAWLLLAPRSARETADSLTEHLASALLAAPPSPATKERLTRELSRHTFPCDHNTVRAATIVLLAALEYQLC